MIAALAAFAVISLLPTSAAAQHEGNVTPQLLSEVLPHADRVSEEKGGDPLVYRGYGVDPSSGEERVVGYAFLTPDLPPEVVGYLGPIHVLVGMDLNATITGVRVVWNREPLAHSLRDFWEDPRYMGQFAGKHASEPFRLGLDLRGITGATISVDAMARGVRKAARRVASTYLTPSRVAADQPGSITGPLTTAEVGAASWFDLVTVGRVKRIVGEVDGMVRIEIFFAALQDEEVARLLMGPRVLTEALRRLGDRADEDHLMFLGLDAQNLAWFRTNMFFAVQGTDTFPAVPEDVALAERLREGMVVDQLGSAGLWILDDRIDISRPFTVNYGGDVGVRIATVEYGGWGGARVADSDGSVEETSSANANGGHVSEASPGAAPSGGVEPDPGHDPPGESEGGESESSSSAGGGEPEGAGDVHATSDAAFEGGFDFSIVEEETQFQRTLARTSWSRVGGLILVLLLATAAFFTKRSSLRWATLAGTVLFLGFMDKGFLSVSHISSAIVVGPGLFITDLSLLILAAFTLVTTLLWGRVFCGYLCPFGALQDFIDRLVPERFQKRVPASIHDRAIWIKYAILAMILMPAITEVAGSPILSRDVSLYGYFEPFGTVFFPSTSVLLWTIAIAFLLASVVVPRFYCRYVCPLGSALAVVSRISPFRIQRVEQCTVCKVCEQICPTGAIRGAEVDFPECVRCSECEVKLLEKAGTCRHDMEKIRPRLIQLRTSQAESYGP